MYKMMILTGSDGNPRSFPPSEIFELEETYPYLIRKHFNTSTVWQLSWGNIPTMALVNQPMAYLTHWKPDIIIVQSGMSDCRPEAFSDFQKEIISKFTWKFFSRISRFVDHPVWIKHRQGYRVSPRSFRNTIKRFKLAFPKSKVLWLEICAGPRYEEARPGLHRRMDEFNKIIKDAYGEDFFPVQQKMLEVGGFNAVDHVHWNKKGHQAVAQLLIEKIHSILNTSKVG